MLVEGPFDVLAPGLLGKAIALCGVKWQESMDYWLLGNAQKLTHIYLWLDPDHAGRVASKHIIQSIRRVVGNAKATEINFAKESGDLSKEEAYAVLRDHGYGREEAASL